MKQRENGSELLTPTVILAVYVVAYEYLAWKCRQCLVARSDVWHSISCQFFICSNLYTLNLLNVFPSPFHVSFPSSIMHILAKLSYIQSPQETRVAQNPHAPSQINSLKCHNSSPSLPQPHMHLFFFTQSLYAWLTQPKPPKKSPKTTPHCTLKKTYSNAPWITIGLQSAVPSDGASLDCQNTRACTPADSKPGIRPGQRAKKEPTLAMSVLFQTSRPSSSPSLKPAVV